MPRPMHGLFISTAFLLPSLFAQVPPPAPSDEINTVLMHATFRISGQEKGHADRIATGTVFVMGVPLAKGGRAAKWVLITAAHVLDDIGPDQATLIVRRRDAHGAYTSYPYDLPIRDGGKPRYVEHRTADVAAMYVALPTDVPVTALMPDFLVDDKMTEDMDLHPGDEVFLLGFPLAIIGRGGFPILRSGHIASYPLTPMKKVKQIDLDALILGGNSGGPVYYSYQQRFIKGVPRVGLWRGVLGLVVKAEASNLPEDAHQSLNYGSIVPAPFIRETIEMLPKVR